MLSACVYSEHLKEIAEIAEIYLDFTGLTYCKCFSYQHCVMLASASCQSADTHRTNWKSNPGNDRLTASPHSL